MNSLKIPTAFYFFAFIFISLIGRNQFVYSNSTDYYKTIKIGRQWLVVIGINRYREWNNLQYPAVDAKHIKNILVKRYHIDNVLQLYNQQATKENIIKIFFQLQKETSHDDSIIIYYAGHGYFDEVTNNGFWIPSDGGQDSFKQVNWLANSLIKGLIYKIRAKHILLLSDSCFSGNILSINRGRQLIMKNEYYHKAYQRISRQVLTSGARETVPDFSEFGLLLRQTLEKNKEPVIDPHMLYTNIRLGITKTTPLLGNLNESGHQEGGSYLLFLKKEFQSENKLFFNDKELSTMHYKTYIKEYLTDLAANHMFDLTANLMTDIYNKAEQTEDNEIIRQSRKAITFVIKEKAEFENKIINEIIKIETEYLHNSDQGLEKLRFINEEVLETNSEFPALFEKIKNAETFLNNHKQQRLANEALKSKPDKTEFQQKSPAKQSKLPLTSHKTGGIISSALGSIVLLTGGTIFCISLVYNDYLENNYIEYSQYVNEKKLTQGFFFSGIAGMAAGAIGISVSIPLFIYKK